MENFLLGMGVNTTLRTLSSNDLSGVAGGNTSYMDPMGLHINNMSITNFRFYVRNLNVSNPNVITRLIDLLFNGTYDLYDYDYIEIEEKLEYIFDRLYVRVIFIVLYTIVFCFCFFGNLMVILVVMLHWRMRNITKFCLANLAFADLCVGVFCVYQNLSTYLINSWVLGEFLCKMYQFVNALSHTAAVLILVVICVERYLAILHPFRAKQIMTINRLRVLIIAVWLVSAIYCSPRLYYIVTIETLRFDGTPEIICTAKRSRFDSKANDIVHFFLLFLLPLLVISILYTRVGITLWRSSKNHHLQVPLSPAGNSAVTNSTNAAGGNLLTISGFNSDTSNEFENETTSSPVPSSLQSRIKIKNKPKAKSHVPSVRFTKLRRRKELNGSDQNPTKTIETCYVVGLDLDTDEGKISNVIETESDADAEFLQLAPAVSPPVSSTTSISLVSTEFSLKNSGKHFFFPGDDPSPSTGSGSGPGIKVRPNLPTISGSSQSSSSTSVKNGNANNITTPGAAPISNSNNNSQLKSKTSIKKQLSRGSGSGSMSFCRGSSYSSWGSRRKSERKKSGSEGQVRQVRSGRDALKSRQTVVKMMIVIVCTFALCNFPFHLRKMFQYWLPNYDFVSIASTLATPLTYLIMYANCAINPLIYAFMSKEFRSSFKDLFCCRWKKSFELGNQHQPAALSQTVTVKLVRRRNRN